jgi:hypothetical protein
MENIRMEQAQRLALHQMVAIKILFLAQLDMTV